VLLAPAFEQVFEGFAHDGFAAGAADLFDHVKLTQVVVDKDLTHDL